MKKFIIKILITAAAIFGVSYLTPALISVRDFEVALAAAFVLAIVNAIIRPAALFLSAPLNLFTIGFFTLVVNAAMLYIAAAVVGPDFVLKGFWQTVVAALVISLVSSWLSGSDSEKR